jgi:excisionase family DNA binding protein
MIAYYFKVFYNSFRSIFLIWMMKEISVERLLTTEEVAELLRIDPVTVRRLIGRGELTAYRIAGEYRFTEADLEKFLESQRVVVEIRSRNQFGDKFTNRARSVLTLASEEARRYNHSGVGTEHMLLALMSEGEGIAAKALAQLQVQENEMRKQIEILHPEEHDHPVVEGMIGVTAQGKAGIECAVQEARGLDHHYLGTEHLLLGVLREEEGLGGKVLRQAGVSLEKTRDVIKQLLIPDRPVTPSNLEQQEER